MFQTIMNEILEPIGRRLGTVAATTLTGYGATHDQVSDVIIGIGAAAGIVLDLYFDRRRRKRDLAALPPGVKL